MFGSFGGMQGDGGFLNFGDYATGNLQDIINHLMQQDPNSHGPPPASTNSVRKLEEIRVDDAFLHENKSKVLDCAVCKDEFCSGEVLKRMPCDHSFHTDCLLPWLQLHNTCPVCRFSLPTEAQDPSVASSSEQGSNSARPVPSSAEHATVAAETPTNSAAVAPPSTPNSFSTSQFGAGSANLPFSRPD